MNTAPVSFEKLEPDIEQIIEWNNIPVDITPILEWATIKIDLDPEAREGLVRSVWTRVSHRKQARITFPMP